jgi:hypothetical protein
MKRQTTIRLAAVVIVAISGLIQANLYAQVPADGDENSSPLAETAPLIGEWLFE